MSTTTLRKRRIYSTDLTGQTFGEWVVIAYAGASKWTCRCSCSTVKDVDGRSLKLARSTNCGCIRQQHALAGRISNGQQVGGKATAEYAAYHGARNRCQNPNVDCYDRYGGRGIEFRFTSFEQFFDEIGPRPSPRHSVDRIDNDGHYEPGNIRWATPTEQANNRRRARRARAIDAAKPAARQFAD